MMKQIQDSSEAVAKAIAAGLEGLKSVTFTLDINVNKTMRGKPQIFVTVTLWFEHSFPEKVSGGDDIVWLTGECRRSAEAKIAKIWEVAKACGLTK